MCIFYLHHTYLFCISCLTYNINVLGDILDVSHFRSWEWNPEGPTRTIIFPFISSGLPFLFLKATSSFFGFHITPHLLLLLPRLWMTMQSLVIDFLIYRLTYRLFQQKEIANVASIIFASSYACWVYCTRTFSNCSETILLGLLLDLATKGQDIQYMQSKNLSSKDSSKQLAKRKQFDLNELEKTKIKNAVFISAIVTLGFFIRISFLGFAVIPVLYWLLEGLSCLSMLRAVQRFSRRIFLLIPGAVFVFICLVLVDCAYFNYDKLLHFAVILQEKSFSKFFEWAKSLPITPLNSLMYNLDVNNLEKHGLHPWFLHLLVNLPLMFSPLVYVLIPALSMPKRYLNYPHCKSNTNILLVCVQTVLFSLAILSFIAHQEPRFLLPLVIPLSVLLSRCFYPFSSHKFYVILWIMFNMSCYVFYALFHQAGLVPTMDFINSLAKVHSDKNSYSKTTNIEVFFYRTYMPPVHLAGIPKQDPNDITFFQVTDLAGVSHDKLEDALSGSLLDFNSEVYLVVPTSLHCSRFRRLQQTFRLEEQLTIFPHLSIEDPSWSSSACRKIINSSSYFLNLADRTTLAIFRVKLLKNIDIPNVSSAIYSPTNLRTSKS